jgi:exonuclease III
MRAARSPGISGTWKTSPLPGNYAPADPDSPAPDFAQMRPYNLASRTLLDQEAADGRPVPDRRVARTLRRNGYVDAAWHLYQRTGDEQLLARTATDDRIDQIWVSAPLAPALHGYRILDTPPGASDHHGLVVHLDTDLIDTGDPWTYR